MNPLSILHETEGFPAGSISNGKAELAATWNDVLWAAMTVGRPDRHYVFRHGDASMYEAIFRLSLVRMALEQSGPAGYRLRRTTAAKTLDPTEKGAVNYFLGMAFCKLFAGKLLNTPWLLHFDVFRPVLNPVLMGRSRPDLIGKENGTGRWHAFECKGRISPTDSSVKQKAKDQALRVISVNGTACHLHIGAITYFRNDVVQFFWRDPTPREGSRIEVSHEPDQWRYYYSPTVELIGTHTDEHAAMQKEPGVFRHIEGSDVAVSVHPAVAEPLFHKKWESAQKMAVEAAAEIRKAGYQPDGLAVEAGDSWRKPFRESDTEEG